MIKSKNINRLYYQLLMQREDTYTGYLANELLQEIQASTPMVESIDCTLKLSICTITPVFPAYIVDWYYELRAIGVKSIDRPQFTIPICENCIVLYLGLMTRYNKLLTDSLHISIKNARLVKQADIDRIVGATSKLRMDAHKVIEELTIYASYKEISIGEGDNESIVTHIDITQLREQGKVIITYTG